MSRLFCSGHREAGMLSTFGTPTNLDEAWALRRQVSAGYGWGVAGHGWSG